MDGCVRITAVDLQWMAYALYVVQVRTKEESDLLVKLISRFNELLSEDKQVKEFYLHFPKEDAKILFCAANEGRCRTNEERLTMGRMQSLFLALSGDW